MVLNNSQYDDIMRSYYARQLQNKNDLDVRTAEVLLAVPEYKALMDRITDYSVEAVKAKMRGDASLSLSLHDRITEIESRMEQLLVHAGFPLDYLSMRYSCPLCQDTGFIANEKCTCFKQAEINLLYHQSNVSEIIASENFDTFSYAYYSDRDTDLDPVTGLTPLDNMKKVVSICKKFIADFPSGDNLLLYGDTGVGKTFLSNCIAKELLDKSHSVLYMSAVELFDYFSKHSGFGEDQDTVSTVTDCDLLIIDDLGTELANSFTNSKLFYCINNRLLTGKSTIISTNFSLEDLMRAYSERIFSRISSSYKLLKLFGDDIRILKK